MPTTTLECLHDTLLSFMSKAWMKNCFVMGVYLHLFIAIIALVMYNRVFNIIIVFSNYFLIFTTYYCSFIFLKSTSYRLNHLIFRVREKTTSIFIALRFRSDLADMIKRNRKCSLSYTEYSERGDRIKMACP